MMTYYPVANDPCGKVGYSTINNQDEQTGVTKVNCQLGQNVSMFARYFATHSMQPPTFNANNPLSMVLSGNDDLYQSFVFVDDLVHQLRDWRGGGRVGHGDAGARNGIRVELIVVSGIGMVDPAHAF